VLSLNGEPEPSIYVEAVTSEASPSTCRRLQEESQTEVDGSFRIRGLQVNIELLPVHGREFISVILTKFACYHHRDTTGFPCI